LEKAREDELVEKQFRKLENCLEADYATLRAENKELVDISKTEIFIKYQSGRRQYEVEK